MRLESALWRRTGSSRQPSCSASATTPSGGGPSPAGCVRRPRDSRQVVDGASSPGSPRSWPSSGEHHEPGPVVSASARNRFVGLVTRVVRDTVMAQVEIQAGPHRVVSLMSREAADELELEPGVLAIASVKSTNVVVELPEKP